MTQKKDKTILITGCSSGFGLISTVYLASKGYDVIATMRNLDKQNALLNELHAQNLKATIRQLDVTDKTSIKQCVHAIAEDKGYIDILVNNAGYGIFGAFEDLTDEEIRTQFETNFFGVQNVTRAFIPMMRNRRGSKIINISSVSGLSSNPCFGAYAASKWALEGFSEGLRYELKQFGIDVLLIEPGSYVTKIFGDNAKVAQRFKDPESPYTPMSDLLEQRVRAMINDNKKEIIEIPELIEKLIIQKKPKFRNIPDLESQIQFTLRKFLPFRAYEAIITKYLNLKKLTR